MFHEGAVGDIAGGKLHLPVVGQKALVLPVESATHFLLRVHIHAAPAQIIHAVIEGKIAGEIALVGPGLKSCFGDEASFVLGVQAKAGAALAQIVQAVGHIEAFGGQQAQRLKHAPFAGDAGSECAGVMQLNVPHGTILRYRARGGRQPERGDAVDFEGGISGEEMRAHAGDFVVEVGLADVGAAGADCE